MIAEVKYMVSENALTAVYPNGHKITVQIRPPLNFAEINRNAPRRPRA